MLFINNFEVIIVAIKVAFFAFPSKCACLDIKKNRLRFAGANAIKFLKFILALNYLFTHHTRIKNAEKISNLWE